MWSKEWVRHLPVFESDQLNPEMMIYSPWSGHRLFAYDFIVNEKPECIVELGSFYGCSSFAFLQAIKDCHLSTHFYAIDTWAGDDFTANDYQEDIYGAYKRIQDSCFSEQNVQMLRMTFNEAAAEFETHSIDVLHIDGSHLYEDVKHDFDTWKDKVREKGFILFHDIGSDLLDGKPLGSHLFWNELKQVYPYTLEFTFSFGLGILFFDKTKYEAYRTAVDFEYYQKQANYAAVQYKDVIRKQYFQIASLDKYVQSLQKQVAVCQEHLERYAHDVQAKDAYIADLESKNTKLTSDCRKSSDEVTKLYSAQTNVVDNYEKTLDGKEKYINELRDGIAKYGAVVQAKDAYIAELETAISDYQADDNTRRMYVADLERKVAELTESVRSLVTDIGHINAEYAENLKKYKRTDESKDAYISELKSTINQYMRTAEEKEKFIAQLHETIRKYEETVSGKEAYIAELMETIGKYKGTVDGKETYIQELLGRLEENKEQTEKLLEKIRYQESVLCDMERQHSADQQIIAELKMQLEECTLEVKAKKKQLEAINETLRNAMVNAKKDAELIVMLQKDLETSDRQIADLRKEVEKLPFGQRILKRMR